MQYQSPKHLVRPAKSNRSWYSWLTDKARFFARLALTSLLVFGQLPAAELSVLPRVDLGGVYESNARMSRNETDEAEGVLVDGSLEIGLKTDRSTIDFLPRLRTAFYADKNDQDLEEEDYYLPLSLDTRTLKSVTRAQIGYNDISIRSSELNTAGENEIGGSADLDAIEDRQRRFYFQPAWNYALSPRVNLRLDGSYSDISYQRTSPNRRFDYDYYSASASIDRQFTDKMNIGVSVDGSEFDAIEPLSGQTNQSTGYGANLFMGYQLSQTLNGSLSVGARKTRGESEFPRNQFGNCSSPLELFFGIVRDCLTKYSGDDFTGNIQLQKNSEQTSYKLNYGRAISPNSNGAEQVRDTISVTADHQLKPNISASLRLLYYQQDTAAALFPRKQDYFNGRLSLRWHFSRHWSLRATYRYTWVDNQFVQFDLTTTESDARNNYVFLGIGWQGLGWRF